MVVAVGFSFATPLEAIAAEFPDTKFVIIDAVVEQPNVQSVVFKEHEGSFLVGMAAAMASKTGKVGFVGGMDIPLIRNFAHGYQQGVKHVSPDAEVFINMTGTTPAAWNDPAKGAELAQSQFDRGADVVYAAAGGTGLGVLQAAADSGKLSIGVDSNQNYLHPGSVLTSMLKRVDVAVYNAFKDAMEGDLKTGVQNLGLAEEGVGYALDEHNRALITPEMEAKLEDAKAKIIGGELEVTDYNSTAVGPVRAQRGAWPWLSPRGAERRGTRRRPGGRADRHRQALRPGPRQPERRSGDPARHHPRHRRGERRRQVDADEHPLRLLSGRSRRSSA